MTLPEHGIVVRESDAEQLRFPTNLTRLLAEGRDTNGAFSAVRATLKPGADGARPHHHAIATELFFVLAGTLDVLVGDDVVSAQTHDLVVVPPSSMHAFANASTAEDADVLIVFGPGIERFDYFRLLRDVVSGKATVANVMAAQERFDNWFGDSVAWNAHRAPAKERRGER